MQAESDELRATGRAILLLIEEIEALHVDLWNAKAAIAEAARDGDGDGDESAQQDLHRSLAERLRLTRGRTSGET